MTKQPQTGAYDRRAIMSKAHREYAASCRRGDGLTFGYWLAYAWRVARDRRQRDMTAVTMRRIAGMIEADLSSRITPAPIRQPSRPVARAGELLAGNCSTLDEDCEQPRSCKTGACAGFAMLLDDPLRTNQSPR